MEVEIKSFVQLSLNELYDLLRLRCEVFVVEQNCVYPDLDDKDQIAIHVMGKEHGKIVAYTRIFEPGKYFENASIGRVVVDKEFRQYGYGKQIMEATITYIHEALKETAIELSAQTYLVRFYNDLGFKEKGKEYLEDGIPHIKMTHDAIS